MYWCSTLDSHKVSTLELFNRILDDARTFPREAQSYKELIQLINFLLRKFFKAVEESPFLVVEVSDRMFALSFCLPSQCRSIVSI